jgi:hypothetical protein
MRPPAHVAFRALQERRRPDCIFTELNTHPAYPLSTLRRHPRGWRRMTRGRADRYSFLVKNSHLLLHVHAGLARRTVIAMLRQSGAVRPGCGRRNWKLIGVQLCYPRFHFLQGTV